MAPPTPVKASALDGAVATSEDGSDEGSDAFPPLAAPVAGAGADVVGTTPAAGEASVVVTPPTADPEGLEVVVSVPDEVEVEAGVVSSEVVGELPAGGMVTGAVLVEPVEPADGV